MRNVRERKVCAKMKDWKEAGTVPFLLPNQLVLEMEA